MLRWLALDDPVGHKSIIKQSHQSRWQSKIWSLYSKAQLQCNLNASRISLVGGFNAHIWHHCNSKFRIIAIISLVIHKSIKVFQVKMRESLQNSQYRPRWEEDFGILTMACVRCEFCVVEALKTRFQPFNVLKTIATQ
ncbi:12842_t:CDS:2, partial [Gigaspora rosea]